MTAHTHTTLVEGCYRCDLGKDEMRAIEEENERVFRKVMRRILARSDLQCVNAPSIQRGSEKYFLVIDDDFELTEDEYDILGEILDSMQE